MKKEYRKKISKTLKEYFKDKTKHPMYGKKHSEESKRKMSESHKGMISSFKGKHHTKESKQKSRLSHLGQVGWWKGKHLSEEHKKKVSDSKKGQIPWNKGNKGEEYKKHYPNGMKGVFQKNQPSWNLGNKGFMADEKHYNWKGGVSKIAKLLWQTYEYQKWRSNIFESYVALEII